MFGLVRFTIQLLKTCNMLEYKNTTGWIDSYPFEKYEDDIRMWLGLDLERPPYSDWLEVRPYEGMDLGYSEQVEKLSVWCYDDISTLHFDFPNLHTIRLAGHLTIPTSISHVYNMYQIEASISDMAKYGFNHISVKISKLDIDMKRELEELESFEIKSLAIKCNWHQLPYIVILASRIPDLRITNWHVTHETKEQLVERIEKIGKFNIVQKKTHDHCKFGAIFKQEIRNNWLRYETLYEKC
jgi:hypothetical protein